MKKANFIQNIGLQWLEMLSTDLVNRTSYAEIQYS